MDDKKKNKQCNSTEVVNISDDEPSKKSFEELTAKFNYDPKTFWNKIPKTYVVIKDHSTLAAVTKDLIAGLFLKEKCNDILSLALDLSFYVKRTAIAQSFLYEKVSKFAPSPAEEIDATEIMVDLESRGWFNKWSKTSSMTNMGKYFFDFFNKSENDTILSFIGPWLATVLLRLEKKQPTDVANKVIKFFRQFINCSEISNNFNDDMYKEWEPMMKRFSKIRLLKQKKDALFKMMIETFLLLKEYDDMKIRRLIWFSALQSLEYGGMTLVSLINHLFRSYKIEMKELHIFEKVITTADTKQSWNTYVDFLLLLCNLSNEESYYVRFSREFDSNAFVNLTYANNMKLCNYVAVMIDIRHTGDHQCFTESKFGPVYKRLISNRINVMLLTNDDFRFCWNAADDLFNIGYEPLSALNAKVMIRLMEESAKKQQKVADEAFKVAEFEQMRVDKYRKRAEEYRKKKIGFESPKDKPATKPGDISTEDVDFLLLLQKDEQTDINEIQLEPYDFDSSNGFCDDTYFI